MLSVALANAANTFLRLSGNYRPHKPYRGVPVYIAADATTRRGFGDSLAFAFGTAIYVRSERCCTRAVLRHEYKHVEQFRAGGLGFTLAYQVETWRVGYWKNRYERQARRAERA